MAKKQDTYSISIKCIYCGYASRKVNGDPNSVTYECRRYPPEIQDPLLGEAIYPRVDPKRNWCGEFKVNVSFKATLKAVKSKNKNKTKKKEKTECH